MPDIRIQTGSELTCPYFRVPEAGSTVLNGAASPRPTISLPGATECHFQLCSADGSNESPADFTFTVAADGTVDYAPAFEHFLAGRGSDCLTVLGLPVQLELQLDQWLRLRLTQARFDARSRYELRLPPCRAYRLDGAAGGFDFGLAADGTVLLEPEVSKFATAGRNSLTVRGFTITVDRSGLDHMVIPLGPLGNFFRWIEDDRCPLTVIPADGYTFQPYAGIVPAWSFGVSSEGHVTLDEEYAGYATVDGDMLTVLGRTVHIDCTALTHDLTPLLLASEEHWFRHGEITPYRAMPAHGYQFEAGACIIADLQVEITLEGNVTLSPDYRGFASARGSTLILRGHTVYIDGRALSHDLQPVDLYPPEGRKRLPRSRVNQLTAIPSNGYVLGSITSGAQASVTFGITRDGQVATHPAQTGFATAAGDTLVLHGYPIVLDATRADSDLVGIGNLLKQPDDPGGTRLGPREILAVLVPSGDPGSHRQGYLPQTANGLFDDGMGFELLVDGAISARPPTPDGYVVSLSASPNPSAAGQEVTFAASVRPVPPGGGIPQGTLSVADGTTVLGSAPLDPHGTASLSTTSLVTGDHQITLTYSGDANFEPASATLRHHVD